MTTHLEGIFAAIQSNDVNYISNHPNQVHYYGNGDVYHPFTFAIYQDKPDIVQKMIQMKTVNPNHQYQGEKPIMATISSKNPQMLEILLKNGANPNLKMKGYYVVWDSKKKCPLEHVCNRMALMWASSVNGSTAHEINQLREIIKVLFRYGADPTLLTFGSEFMKEYVQKRFWFVMKEMWLPVGIALRHLTAHEQMMILENMIPGVEFIPINKRWKLVTSIKHWK